MSFLQKLFAPTNIKNQTHREYNEIFMRLMNIATGIPLSTNKSNLIDNGYKKNATVYSIVNYICNAASSIPVKVYQVTDRQAAKDYKSLTKGVMNETAMVKASLLRGRGLKPAPDSELQMLLDNPNPDMGYSQWMNEIVGYLELTGDTYIQGVAPTSGRNMGKVKGLYALPAHLMEIVLSGDVTEPIKGYRLILQEWSKELPYEAVAHVKTFNPDFDTDGRHLYGQSPLQAAYRNLVINNDAITTGNSMLKNQGVKGILTPDDMMGITQEQAQAVKNRFRKQYQGAENAGDIMITPQAFRWINMGSPAADLALIEQYNLSKKDIAAAYNFPSLLLNDTEEFSVSTYREAKKQLYLQRVIPDLTLVRDELNRWLTPTYGDDYYVDFDYMSIPELQEDMEKVTKQLNVAWWFTPNEKRTAMMADPLEKEGMDDIYVPANLINLSTDAIAGELQGGNPMQRLMESFADDYKEKAESYSDYPDAAVKNAKKVLKYVEENGWGDCGTPVGKERANQIASREPLSLKTIKRTFSYLSRAEEYYDGGSLDKCGNLSYLAWGGKPMKSWCEKKINELEEIDSDD